MRRKGYTKAFFEQLHESSARSAEVIVPLVLQLLQVQSVVDLGCGDGAWLAAFRNNGVDDVIGVDGDYVDRQLFRIPGECFRSADLSKPILLGRMFDLAISLEVAEHLPPESAAGFVKTLVGLSPAVLFSAAIPFQGGTDHLNEQWLDRWAELFKIHGYRAIDFVRRRVWRNEAVEFWYAQNTLLYARQDLLESNHLLKAEFELTNLEQLRVVHPNQYLRLINNPGLKVASRIFGVSLKNAIQFRARRLWRK